MSVLLITGPFRSGTSLVASMAHRMGWPVAVTMTPPIPPSWRADWEDMELTQRLLLGDRPTAPWLVGYVERRREFSRRMGFDGRVAIKSPYLALIWTSLLTALRGEEVLVVRCTRERMARQRSVLAYPQLSLHDEQEIEREMDRVTSDLEIGYERAVDRPLEIAEALAELLGVVDPVAVAAAAALVGHPTEYPCLSDSDSVAPQSSQAAS